MHYSTMRWLIASAGLAAAACSDQMPAAPAATTQSAAEAQTSPDPFRLRGLRDVVSSAKPPTFAQVSPEMTVRFLGHGDLLTDAPVMPSTAPSTALAARTGTALPIEPATTRPTSARFHLFNSATQNAFEIELSGPMLGEIQQARAAAGLTVGTPGVALERAGGFQTAALAGGVDDRVVRTPTTTWPWRTVAQLSVGGNASDCTATLIGPRHIITAAHCLVAAGTSNWRSMRVTPARDGLSSSPYGSSQLSLSDPRGRETWYFTPAEWRDPKVANKQPFDWGLAVIPDRLGDATGWQGYLALPANQLINFDHFNRGYPSCDASIPDRPANCQTARMYGDKNDCALGTYASPGSDGWSREVSFGCDVSRGQDGSSLYQNYFDPSQKANVSVVVAVMTRQECTTCSPSTQFPAWAHRLTPSDLAVISWLRQPFP